MKVPFAKIAGNPFASPLSLDLAISVSEERGIGGQGCKVDSHTTQVICYGG